MGAVISHVLPDGSERPVAFASRTLTPSEQKYAQIEKEALALIFGMTHLRIFYGQIFILVMDHNPLTSIMGLGISHHWSLQECSVVTATTSSSSQLLNMGTLIVCQGYF